MSLLYLPLSNCQFPPPPTAMWSPKTRYPSKAALTWTPGKTAPPHHIR